MRPWVDGYEERMWKPPLRMFELMEAWIINSGGEEKMMGVTGGARVVLG